MIELGLQPKYFDEIIHSKIISSIVASIILNKDHDAKKGIISALVEKITILKKDEDALFISYILRSIRSQDDKNDSLIISQINSKKDIGKLINFRKVLYDDILMTSLSR